AETRRPRLTISRERTSRAQSLTGSRAVARTERAGARRRPIRSSAVGIGRFPRRRGAVECVDRARRSTSDTTQEGTMSWDDEQTVFKVVVNHEEQYSIWPIDRVNPPGWRDAGKSGVKTECLAYIDEVWTDMRPLSL